MFSPRSGRRQLLAALQIVFALAVLWYATHAIASQWGQVRQHIALLRPRWWYVGASSFVVLAAYALLIQTWRFMLSAWGERLGYVPAARIWFVSNLGKYLPGKVWQIAAMAVMAERRGVSPVAATGSSVVVNLANVVSGFVVVLAAGAPLLKVAADTGARGAVLLTVGLLVALLALPAALPLLASLAGRLTRREIVLPRLPARAIWAAAAGTAMAWVLYGVAFKMLTSGVLPPATGATPAYVAVYTSSYIVGYLWLVAPGGIGVRETMLVVGMTTLGLSSEPRAWVLAIVSRLWLTVLELLPGFLFMLGSERERSATERKNGTS